jgi:hypothetical protein
MLAARSTHGTLFGPRQEITVSHYQQKAGSRHGSRIDVNQEQECRYWAERLGVYPGALKEAVIAVGDALDDLWRYIDERKHET